MTKNQITLKPFSRLRYCFLSLRGITHCIHHPLFMLRVLYARLGFTLTRRFVGPTLKSPEGDIIFNVQSLVNYWIMFVVREQGDRWRTILREAQNPVVFDVGSNIGQFGTLARSINFASTIAAFDPWPNMATFNRACTHYKAVAVGDRFGEVTLTKSSGDGWTASTSPGFYSGKKLACPMEPLDHLWEKQGWPPVTVLKIDVDGAEEGVLRGATKMLKHVHCIVIEINDPAAIAELPDGFDWHTVNYHDWIGIRQ